MNLKTNRKRLKSKNSTTNNMVQSIQKKKNNLKSAKVPATVSPSPSEKYLRLRRHKDPREERKPVRVRE